MNWYSVFHKISYLGEGMGNRTKPLLLAGCEILQLREITDSSTWKPLALVHMYARVCIQGTGGPKIKPHTSQCYQQSARGTELAESQELPCGLCCNFPHSAEEREGLSEGSPRLTSNHIHGEDLAEKIY